MHQYAAFETFLHMIMFTQKNENQKFTQGEAPSPIIFSTWMFDVLQNSDVWDSDSTDVWPE